MDYNTKALLSVSQTVLLDLLRTDIDLAFTFLQTAEITNDRVTAQRAVGNASTALEKIRELAGKLKDPAARKSIDERTNALEAAIRTFQSTVANRAPG